MSGHSNLSKCHDQRGITCFANSWDNRCKALSDTTFYIKCPYNGKCPFYKTVHQVIEEDPNYFKDQKKGMF